MAGIILDWYDFSLFLSMGLILSKVFFPEADSYTAQIATFSLFASGYLARPIGAVVFGHFGDKLGRKTTLFTTIALMTLSTTFIGLIPASSLYAIYVLALCRLIQGFAASGEYGGGVTLLYELAPSRKSLYACLGLFAAIIGITFGTIVVAAVVKYFGTKAMIAYGWRIPFLLGAPLGVIAFFMRLYVNESRAFTEIKKSVASVPVITLFKTFKKRLLLLFSFYSLSSVVFYINCVYLTSQASLIHHISQFDSLALSSGITLLYALSMLFFAYLSDYTSKLLMMAFSCIVFILTSSWLFRAAIAGSIYDLIICQSVMSVFLGMFVAPLAFITAESFPTKVRYSGVGIPLNLTSSILGGTTPLICAWLVRATNNNIMPSYILSGTAFIALIAIYILAKNESSARYLEIVNSV